MCLKFTESYQLFTTHYCVGELCTRVETNTTMYTVQRRLDLKYNTMYIAKVLLLLTQECFVIIIVTKYVNPIDNESGIIMLLCYPIQQRFYDNNILLMINRAFCTYTKYITYKCMEENDNKTSIMYNSS